MNRQRLLQQAGLALTVVLLVGCASHTRVVEVTTTPTPAPLTADTSSFHDTLMRRPDGKAMVYVPAGVFDIGRNYMELGLLLICGIAAYLLLSVITSATCASARSLRLKTVEGEGKVPILYWVVPQILGLGLAAFLGYLAFAIGVPRVVVVFLAMNVILALSTAVGHVLMQRLERRASLAGAVLLVPLIFVACLMICRLAVFAMV